jgi:hypothetical protein
MHWHLTSVLRIFKPIFRPNLILTKKVFFDVNRQHKNTHTAHTPKQQYNWLLSLSLSHCHCLHFKEGTVDDSLAGLLTFLCF